MKSNFKPTYLFLWILTFAGAACSQAPLNQDRPNIVLIMADDMGYECVGANGSTEYHTPNLDRLAASGIRFEHCYSQPLCTPSRVKIMTGKFNFRNYEDFGYLNPGERTFGNILKDAGYATCVAGKWQLNGMNSGREGNQDVTRPNHFGFDECCLWQLNRTPAEGERYADPLLTQNGTDLPRDPDAYGPQVVADFISRFIERNAGKPFFVYYPMILPHNPFVPTPDSPEWNDPALRNKKDTAFFDDMIAYVDKIIGQLEKTLKEQGVWDNTLFIFTGDNGTNRTVISSTHRGAVRGAKGQTINTGNHVPMIISWPRVIREHFVFSGMVDFTDILPTLAEVAGVDPAEYTTDGMSFLPVLHGDKSAAGKAEVFIHYTPRWGTFEHNRWVMNREYKLYRDGRFFHTATDPLEKNAIENPSESEAVIRSRFDEILQAREEAFSFHKNNELYDLK